MVLERLFAWIDRVLGARNAEAAGILPARRAAAEVRLPRGRERWPSGALLSVDGAGQYLLCAADALTLGHLRAGRADLGFLAGVGALHARLQRADSLQAGPGWRVQPLEGERVRVDGRVADAAGLRLTEGARLTLGENLEMRASLPDPASATFLLELLHGAECAGAQRVLLLARGPGGRVRIGGTRACHVRVPGLEFELALEWHEDGLRVTSELELSGALEGREGTLALPPRERLAFACGQAHGPRPPFGLSLEPVERAGGAP